MSIKQTPEWNEKLLELMQFFIKNTTPKALGRLLRNFFLLNISGLKTVPPEWEDNVLHIIAMLELIDAAEDDENSKAN